MKKLILLLSLVAGSVHATSDPTRPPAAWLNAGSAASAVAPEVGGPRLQSVLLPQRGRPVVVISGVTVALGGQYGEAKLVRVTEREAILQGADGVTHLYLTPEVEKQVIVVPPSKKSGRRGHKRDLP